MFTGHRNISKIDSNLIKTYVKENVKNLIENRDYNVFVSGAARGFDILAANAVIELKKEYSNIKLMLAIPCLNQTNGWREEDKLEYINIVENADKLKILSTDYKDGCMIKRNNYMVDMSSYCVYYLRQKTGGTYKTVNYAIDKKLVLVNIYELMSQDMNTDIN